MRFEGGLPARDGGRSPLWDAAGPNGKGGNGRGGRHRGGGSGSYGRYGAGQGRSGPEHPPH